MTMTKVRLQEKGGEVEGPVPCAPRLPTLIHRAIDLPAIAGIASLPFGSSCRADFSAIAIALSS